MSAESVYFPTFPTTWMLRNVRTDHTLASLHALLSTLVDGHSYNLLFLPWVRNKKRNAGFAFVNFLNSDGAAEAIAALSGRHWPDTRQKEIGVCPADVQGFQANLSTHTTGTAWQTLLLLHNGKQICEKTALSLYAARSFAERHVLQGRQSKGTEGEVSSFFGPKTEDSLSLVKQITSSSSRSDPLQKIIRSVGMPSLRRGAAAMATQGLSAKDLLNTPPNREVNDFARWRMESEVSTGDATAASFSTSPPVSTGSRSNSSFSRIAAAQESLAGHVEPASPTWQGPNAVMVSYQMPAHPAHPAQSYPAGPPATPERVALSCQTALANRHRWAAPVRTPPFLPQMMAMPLRNASEVSMTMQDSASNCFGPSSIGVGRVSSVDNGSQELHSGAPLRSEGSVAVAGPGESPGGPPPGADHRATRPTESGSTPAGCTGPSRVLLGPLMTF